MEKKNTGLWWVIGAIVVIIIIVLIVRAKNDSDVAPATGDTTSQTDDTNALTATEDISAGSVNANGSTAAMLTYQQALTKYGTSRIQFGTSCQATPNQATWANGTNLMLDNRSADARTLHLGSMGDVSVKAWGFKIVNFSSTLLPNVIQIDCDAQQNVAQITIQK